MPTATPAAVLPNARYGATNCARASLTTYGKDVLTGKRGSSPAVLPEPTQLIRQWTVTLTVYAPPRCSFDERRYL